MCSLGSGVSGFAHVLLQPHCHTCKSSWVGFIWPQIPTSMLKLALRLLHLCNTCICCNPTAAPKIHWVIFPLKVHVSPGIKASWCDMCLTDIYCHVRWIPPYMTKLSQWEFFSKEVTERRKPVRWKVGINPKPHLTPLQDCYLPVSLTPWAITPTLPFGLKAACFGAKPKPNLNQQKPAVQKTTLHRLMEFAVPLPRALATLSAQHRVLLIMCLSSPLQLHTAEMVLAVKRAPPIPNSCPGGPRHWPLERCPQIIDRAGWHANLALANQQQVGVFPHSLERNHYLLSRGHHPKTSLCLSRAATLQDRGAGKLDTGRGSSGAWRPS